MKNISITVFIKKIGKIFYRYNLVIFIVLVTGGLIASIMILNQIITQPGSSTTNDTTPSTTSFDQPTINRLSKLESNTKNTNYQTLPSGRINPFLE